MNIIRKITDNDVIGCLLLCMYFSPVGSKAGPEPTPPSSTTTTPKTSTKAPKPTPPAVPTTTASTDPSKDACQVEIFDAITEIEGELHFFKDG